MEILDRDFVEEETTDCNEQNKDLRTPAEPCEIERNRTYRVTTLDQIKALIRGLHSKARGEFRGQLKGPRPTKR